MADETEVQDFDPFAGLDFDEGEAAVPQEDTQDARMARIEENQRKIAQRLATEDEAKRIETMKVEFYAQATDTEKEIAQVFLEGTETMTQVERAIKLIKTKAGVATPAAPVDEADTDTGDAFAPPVNTAQTRTNTPDEELSKQLKAGTLPFSSLLETFRSAPPGAWTNMDPRNPRDVKD